MESREAADGTLVVTHDGTRFAKWLAAGGGALAVAAIAMAVDGSPGDERVLGAIGGAAILGVASLAFAETARFEFAPRRRIIRWRRRWAWWHREGTIRFDEVKDVLVERPIGDHGVPSRRIVLRLADRSTHPLRAAFVPDVSDETLRIAERIRAALGRPVRPAVPESVQSLLEQGRRIEAVKLLREESDLSLADAVNQVDELEARLR